MLRLQIVEIDDDRLAVRLIAGDDLLACCDARARHEQIGAWGEELQRSLNRAWQRETTNPQHLVELREWAMRLGESLFSPEFCDTWAKTGDRSLSLEVPRKWLFVPWEMAWVRGRSIATQYSCGRSIQEMQSSSYAVGNGVSAASRSICVWANPGFDLLAAEEEASIIRAAFVNRSDGRLVPSIERREMSQQEVLLRMSKATWFHFAGHAQRGSTGRCWRVGNSELNANEVANFVGAMPHFVFAHACGSAGIHRDDTEVSLLEAFLQKGTCHYLGLWTPARDRLARQFTRVFYPLVADGSSVGAALLETRLLLAEQHHWTDLLLGNYVLYGNPDICYWPREVTADRKGMAAKEAGTNVERTEIAKVPHPRELTYPRKCESCQRELKSHFLVQEVRVDDGEPLVTCRYCHAATVDRPAASILRVPDHDVVQGMDGTPSGAGGSLSRKPMERSAPPEASHSMPSEGLPSAPMPRGWFRLIDGLQLEREFLDPATGLPCRGKWRVVGDANQPRLQAKLQGATILGSHNVPDWRLDLICCRATEAVTREHLAQLVAVHPTADAAEHGRERRPARSGWHGFIFVAPTGFSNDLSEAVQAGQAVLSEIPPSVVLVDLQSTQPILNSRDLWARAAAAFLDWEDIRDRVRRILDHVEQLRPLARSLSATDLAITLGVPIEAVVAAWRNLCASGTLRLDHVDPFGWILSEKDV